MNNVWKFDQEIAKIFVNHARQHIPNYESVIDKCIEVCRYRLSSTSSIIDVGCATGQTLVRLQQAGFVNLTGVDSSPHMIDQCKVSAELICSETFPNQVFDAILCNWTLHFIKHKVEYLSNIYQNLSPGGFLILSDKTSKDQLPLHFYHQFKSKAGVSDQAIQAKADSVKNIMHIDSPEWYIENLQKLGFSKVYIIDASWCFTTFLCTK